ncbi:Outer membrane receptor proteins, mostly Fe transport [Spirosoma endophyticum]|uniref:Outer membrane receptor proteins, mostly Fe transport n=2 Tax=Spirosoma endophyticum TaxID=662367 RepID=A0A1I1VMB9_9BACT|nr:Outer membrane receptor proteins, mostly Fe transport [Spirosoma endophyticum]
MMNRSILFLLLFLSYVAAVAAKDAPLGTVRGTIRDEKTKEALIGCTVRIDGTQLGVTTDVEGNFVIPNVPAGTQKIVISYISYKTKEIPNVRVESGNTTVVETELTVEGQALQEVVVRGNRATNTEIAVITEIKQLKPIAVGISAMQIQKSQDRDAAAAIRRVPGVSIVDNRFVLIRGLGTRYNNVLINDVIAPSTEVESRSFSFDIVPSNILDRMIVYKSGSAELPGDFAGGVIKIYTKRRPEQNFTDVGVTVGYRANTTFQNVQTHSRGGLSFLGLWDAKSQLPSSFPAKASEFNGLSSVRRASYARLLPNDWALKSISVAPDVRIAVNTGRRFELGNVRVSNLTSINYALTNQFQDVNLRLYENTTANDVQQEYNDATYAQNTRLGILHNWTFRFSPRFTLEWKTLYNQLGATETVVRNGSFVIDGVDVRSYSERFENRSILNTQVSGEHSLSELSKVNWIASYGYSGRWEPDWKRAQYTRPVGATGPDGQPEPFRLNVPVQPSPLNLGRFYSKLNEQVVSMIGNYDHTFGNPTDREPNRIKAGFYGERRNRDFAARFYGYERVGLINNISGLAIGQALAPENVTGREGSFSLQDGTVDNDSYNGQTTYAAGYVSGDVNIGSRANLTLGFRGEFYNQTLRLTSAVKPLVDNNIFSPLPSVNFTYKLTEQQNLRFAYSSTVNRPELRELAPFRYYDFARQIEVIGNPRLKTATIQNFDAKYEFYPTPNELISITAFYKSFKDPIESFLIPIPGNFIFTFTNALAARNYGVEIEFRKGFANSGSTFLQNLQIVGNASYINSRVTTADFIEAPGAGGAIELVGNSTDRKRALANQSPYLINLGLYYANPTSGWQYNLLYNVAGPRIFLVGNIEDPTTYEMPRHVVDFNISKTIKQQFEVRLGIQDILNAPFRFAQDYNGDRKIGKDVTSRSADADQNYINYRRGQYVTLTGVYTFGRRTVVP